MTREARLDQVEWSRYADGSLPAERCRELEELAATDPVVSAELEEAREMREALSRPLVSEPAARSVAGRVMKAIEAGEGRRRGEPGRGARRRALFAGSSVAIAAAAAMLLFLNIGGETSGREKEASSPGTPPGEFRARGKEVPAELSRRVGVDLVLVSGESLASGDAVAPDSAYVGAYQSLLEGRAYLMVFAVDAGGTIHWLYPGWVDPARDPKSLALAPSQERTVLSDGVVLADPAPGPMRIVTLLSRQPHRVSELEALAPGELVPDALEARWPEVHAEEIEVEVSP